MTVIRFEDLPLADRDPSWDARAAEKRGRRWAGAEASPNARHRKAFPWYDVERKDEFAAYKLPVTEVVDGELRALPRGIVAAAQVAGGGRGGVDIPSRDLDGVKRNIARYYDKLGKTAALAEVPLTGRNCP